MTYKVLKNGRKATNQEFTTYERARQWVRKQLRKATPWRYLRQPDLGMFGMSSHGYTIKAVS
jgi:hypothetical protein